MSTIWLLGQMIDGDLSRRVRLLSKTLDRILHRPSMSSVSLDWKKLSSALGVGSNSPELEILLLAGFICTSCNESISVECNHSVLLLSDDSKLAVVLADLEYHQETSSGSVSLVSLEEKLRVGGKLPGIAEMIDFSTNSQLIISSTPCTLPPKKPWET